MSLSGVEIQDYRPTPRSKSKCGQIKQPGGASTSFDSPNHFAVLSESNSEKEDTTLPSQANKRKPRIPPTVIYRYRNNHSATLKKVREKLSAPVDVQSKSHLLDVCT
jgi:hypothetical protein